MFPTVLLAAIAIAIGATGGAILGGTRSCESGACPLTATPLRGGLYGGTIGLLVALSLGTMPAADHKQTPRTQEGVTDMATADLTQTIHLDQASFDTATSKGLAVVDFWAPWCGPCRMLGPIIDQLAAKTGDDVLVAKVNVDENPALAQRYDISGIPCMILLKDGKEVDRKVGVQQLPALQQWVDSHR
ncbi:MAG: thioredoxin [Planctomycetota bacterium]